MDWLIVVQWACIGLNLSGAVGCWLEGRRWERRIGHAARCLNDATAKEIQAYRILGAAGASSDGARLAAALVFIFQDDRVADRTKDALTRHLSEVGVDLAALAERTMQESGNA